LKRTYNVFAHNFLDGSVHILISKTIEHIYNLNARSSCSLLWNILLAIAFYLSEIIDGNIKAISKCFSFRRIFVIIFSIEIFFVSSFKRTCSEKLRKEANIFRLLGKNKCLSVCAPMEFVRSRPIQLQVQKLFCFVKKGFIVCLQNFSKCRKAN
jgi:hypothetical protein